MKTTLSKSGPLLAALLIASCSQGPAAPTAAQSPMATADNGGGLVSGAAAGDVKNGPIEINLVRVAQTDGVPAFYADAGGAYTVRPGREVEIYIQIWTSNPPVEAPRLIVDWGVGERDNIHCGPCRLSRTYGTGGQYTVTVTMDDRVGGVTSRTFTLGVSNPGPEVVSGLGTFNGSLDASDPQFNRRDGSFVPPSTGLPCNISESIPNYYDTYTIHHPGGTLHAETILGTLSDSFIFLYASTFNPANACQNSVASNDDNIDLESLFDASVPAGDYILVVTSYDAEDTGTYTVIIR